MRTPPLFSISVLSAAALGYEILLMRLFSIIQWHHFAYMMISIALLGYGAAGTFVMLARRGLTKYFSHSFVVAALLFSISTLGCFALAQQVAFNPLEILWDPVQPLRLLVVYLLLFVPFFWAATCICLAFTYFPDKIHRIYSFDIFGAGVGSIAIVAAMFVVTPTSALKFVSIGGIVAAALACFEWRMRRLATVLFAVAVALPNVLPKEWPALDASPYKDLSQALSIKGAEVVAAMSSPLAEITVVGNREIPLRHAPGLSLNATMEPPQQFGVFTDGDGPNALARYDGRREPLAYLDYLTSALPYHLLRQPQVLVLGAGAGADVLQAIYHLAPMVDAVEINPLVIDLVQNHFGDFSGKPYSAPGVRIHIAEARGFVTSTDARYDLIQVALLDAFGAASAGLHALSESYLYTIEALQEYLRHLNPGGMLAITRWVQLPPRDVLKLTATAISALEKSGVRVPARQLVLIRGWKTATLLVKSGEFTAADIEALKQFCKARSFDVAFYPGMTAGEANRYNVLDQPYFFESVQALLGEDRETFTSRYKFNISPATDNRPYFFHFFKWQSLRELFAFREQGGLTLLEWGYPMLVATLVQAAIASFALILLPLWIVRRRTANFSSGAHSPQVGASVKAWRPGSYFLAIGFAFMFIEIAFIQKFILFLHHPLYAVAVVLSSFLVFAGMGSGYSSRLHIAPSTSAARLAAFFPQPFRSLWRPPVARPIFALCLIAATYLVLLPVLFRHFVGFPDIAKILISALLIAPLAFCMGMPFPMGLATTAKQAEWLIPWAWGINACASVVGAIAATLLAIHLGFTAVVVSALLLYIAAAAVYPVPVSPDQR